MRLGLSGVMARLGRSTWPSRVVTFILSLAMTLEAWAWSMPDSDAPGWFRPLQCGALTLVAMATLVACGAWTFRAGWAAAALPRGALTILALLAVAWPYRQLDASLDVTHDEMQAAFHEGVHMRGVIAVRRILEPGWEHGEADWLAERYVDAAKGMSREHAGTPGIRDGFNRQRRRCPDLFLHADAYPTEVCEASTIHYRDVRTARQALYAVTGGTLLEKAPYRPKVDDVIGGPGFARARAIYGAYFDDRGVPVREGITYRDMERAALAARDLQPGAEQ